MKLIATKKEELAICPIDLYSIGHVAFGYITYLLILLITNSREWSFTSAMITGLGWEFIENFLLIKTPYKSKQDSLENSLTDIVFVFIGACISQTFSFLEFSLYMSSSALLIASLVLIQNIFNKLIK